MIKNLDEDFDENSSELAQQIREGYAAYLRGDYIDIDELLRELEKGCENEDKKD
jgi:hypothetical protein